jgi:hypothetical protein
MKHLIRSLLALGLLVASQAVATAEEILLQSVQSGMYVTVVDGTLAAAAPDARYASRFDTVRLEGNRHAFRDVRSGSFVRAGVGQGTFLASGSPHIRGWETFEVLGVNGRDVALRSVQNGKFVRAGVGRRSHLAAVSDRAAGWETFRFVPAGRGNGQAGNQQGSNQAGLNLGDLAGNYRITHIAAQNGFLVELGQAIASQARLSLNARGEVNTTVGCNTITTRISVRNGRMSGGGQVMMTKRLCGEQGLSRAEAGLLEALRTSRTVDRQGRTVVFTAGNGAEMMKIERR